MLLLSVWEDFLELQILIFNQSPPVPLLSFLIDLCPLCIYGSDLLSDGPQASFSSVQLLLQCHCLLSARLSFHRLHLTPGGMLCSQNTVISLMCDVPPAACGQHRGLPAGSRVSRVVIHLRWWVHRFKTSFTPFNNFLCILWHQKTCGIIQMLFEIWLKHI